ncbi:hypothetical protein KGQ71_01455 [Patescibacteria group bacterium]|nr:hypothetical protein [Patescibacteria group bacterium]
MDASIDQVERFMHEGNVEEAERVLTDILSRPVTREDGDRTFLLQLKAYIDLTTTNSAAHGKAVQGVKNTLKQIDILEANNTISRAPES